MDVKGRQLTLVERWELDIKSAHKDMDVKTSTPQCKRCKYFIKGNALNCERYLEEKKPREVMFCHKECNNYESDNVLNVKITDDEASRLFGGVFGFCVGDMLGVPVEFSTREQRDIDNVKELRAYGTYHQPFGTWSDDTSLMLCLIDAFNKGYSEYLLASNFVKFYKEGFYTPHGKVFDIGIATQNAIEKIIEGVNLAECGGKEERDNGNGSLMRVLPIAFAGKNLDDLKFIEMVENISAITHAHSRAKLACIFYVKFAMQLILGKDKTEAYNDTITFINKNCYEKYSDEFNTFGTILNREIIHFNRNNIKSTGYVIDTLEAVLWTFFNSKSYDEMVLNAVNLGGDTDTIAAIVGGLGGIYYGFESIPNRWVQNVCRKNEIYEMVNDFYEMIKNKKG